MAESLKRDERTHPWMPAALWAFLILVVSVLPYGGSPPLSITFFDKIAHFLGYAVLALLMVRAVYCTCYHTPYKTVLFILISGGGYGIVMELIQGFIPGRDASLHDVIANIIGIIFGIIAGEIAIWRK